MEHKQLNRIIAAVVFGIAFIVYSMTVAPTTSYWDCGEFITCSYTLAVPHPPGAPLYIMLGRLFSMVPYVQDIGLRVNMISVLVSAFSVMFTYLIIVRLLRTFMGIPQKFEEKLVVYSGGVIGALGFAFTDSFWFNAVEAEVYAGSLFFTAIVVWLILVWTERADEPGGDKVLLLIAYVMGLATGVHLLNILAIPCLFLIIYFRKNELQVSTFLLWSAVAAAIFGLIYPGVVKGIPWLIREFSFAAVGLFLLAMAAGAWYAVRNNRRVISLLLMAGVLITIGYSTYMTLYIRSGLSPSINENHPNTPAKLVSYLNREQYGDIPVSQRRAPMWSYQLKKMYIRYFAWQFVGQGNTLGRDNYITEVWSYRGLMGLPFLVGLLGMLYHFKLDWKRASSILALFIMTGVAITIYLNQEDPQPRERDYAYVASFFAFAIWIGMGASALLELVLAYIHRSALLRKVGVVLMLAVLVLAVPVNLLSNNYHDHDRTGNYVAYDYSYNILQSCEQNAILFTNGDNDTFPLWFLQYVYNIRRDVRVVNLSLLNTNWYIKQLRDEEPRVPISYSDDQVDALQAILWEKPRPIKVDVARETVLKLLAESEDNSGLKPQDIPAKPAVAFELANTKVISGHPVLLVQDRMVMHIIAANKFKKPIYFAVTVAGANMLNLDNRRNVKGGKNYLRMDGLVFRVMPYSGPFTFMSPRKMETNLFEKFQYRNLNNPNVHYTNNIKGLLQNYRSAFIRLTNHYQTEGEKEKALAVLDKMEEVLPESIIPLRDYRLSLNFGRIYADAGRPEELERRLQNVLTNYALAPTEKVFLAEYYRQELKEPARAESLVVSVLDQYPDVPQSYSWLVSHYSKGQEYDKAVGVLEKWVARNPRDQGAQKQLSELRAVATINRAPDAGAAPRADSTGSGGAP